MIDFLKDEVLMDSDTFGLGETWLNDGDIFEVESFKSIFANAGRGKGVSAHTQQNIQWFKKIATESYSAILLKMSFCDVLFLYISKGFDEKIVADLIQSWIDNEKPTAIIGDMNWHFAKENKLKKFTLKKFLTCKCKFIQLITSPTHEEGSILDHIYINEKLSAKDTFVETEPVYYSDHDIISLYIKK